MPRFLILNNAILFLCCSIYLGTGVSLIWLQFPVEPLLTPDNYYLIFVEPIARATTFFTNVTIIMMITGGIMLVTEWFSGLRWVPIVVLAAVGIASMITVYLIFPYNNALADGITDPDDLKEIFATWTDLARWRMLFWSIEWFAMMYYFCALAYRARADK